MAVVAQLVEHLVVIQDVAGSSPVGRPFLHLPVQLDVNAKKPLS
jgi:hypothetical protein